jgi:alpha-tubulin suppressor-like RCC1 family protein
MDARTDWISVSEGALRGCGTRSDHTLWCWGSGFDENPVQVGDSSDWISISEGNGHHCGVRSDGTLWCWGSNSYGAVGDGTTTARPTPTHIGVGTHWASVSGAHDHTCAIQKDSVLRCWGVNVYGQCGSSVWQGVLTPTVVEAHSDDWAAVSTGGFHACGIRSDHTMWCWGQNDFGQLGHGDAWATSPVRVLD